MPKNQPPTRKRVFENHRDPITQAVYALEDPKWDKKVSTELLTAQREVAQQYKDAEVRALNGLSPFAPSAEREVEAVHATVWVRRHWNDSLGALYRLDDVGGWHWSSVSGGVMARSPRPFLHGYVMCDAMLDGELSHSCLHGPPPHRVKVCFVQKDNPRWLFEEVKHRVVSRGSSGWVVGGAR